MAMTKTQALSRLRGRLRDSSTDFHDEDYVDEMFLSVLRDEIGNCLAQVNPDHYFTIVKYTAFTHALDGTVGEYYPLPDNINRLRRIFRADLSHEPTLWQPMPELQHTHRFTGVMQGTLSLGDQTYSVPRLFAGQTAVPQGDKRFRVLPPPTSSTEKFGVAFDRRPTLVYGDQEAIDIPECFEEAFVLATAHKMLVDDGDPHADNVAILLRGEGRDEDDIGAWGRAKKTFERMYRANMVLGRMRTP